MDKQHIEDTLRRRAEQMIPTDMDPWPAVQARLLADGTTSGVQQTRPSRRLHPAAALAFSALLLAAILLSPQGRAWADRLLHLFTPAGSETLPLPTVPVTLYDVTPGAPAPTSTISPEALPALYADCGHWAEPRCTVEEFRALSDFDVKGFSPLPAALQFVGVTGGPDRAWLTYRCADSGCSLRLSVMPWTGQSPAGGDVSSEVVIEPVQIGGISGEYVQGGWLLQEKGYIWDTSLGQQTLRWINEDGMFFELSVFGSLETNGRLISRPELIAWAVALAMQPASVALDLTGTLGAEPLSEEGKSATLSPGRYTTIEEAEAVAGFAIFQPGWLPLGFALSHVSHSPQADNVCLHYRHSTDDYGASLHIVESPTTPLPKLDEILSTTPNAIHRTATLTVGGATGGVGTFAWGGINAGSPCGDEELFGGEALLWETHGMRFQAYAPGVPEFANYVTKLDLQQLAEGLTGVTTLAADQLDPERLPSPEAAETLAGFDVQAPTRLPPGNAFSHATHDAERGLITLVYDDLWIQQAQARNATDTLGALDGLPPEAIEPVQIGDIAAVYTQGCWTKASETSPTTWDRSCTYMSLVWQADGVVFVIRARLYLGTAQETLIAIAESLI